MVSQYHSGPGDNVAGDKIENIIRSIQSGDLCSVLAQVFNDICCRDFSSVYKKIEALTEVESLESDVVVLLKALNLRVDIASGVSVDNSEIVRCRENLLRALKQEKYSSIENYVQAILIELEVRLDRNQGQKRVDEVGLDDPYIREVYFEHLASTEEVLGDHNTNLMSKNELAGLIRGAIRVEEFQRAVDFSSKSMTLFNDENSEALLFYSRALCLNSDLAALHYNLMPTVLKKIFDELIGCISIDRCRVDRRYLYGLVILLHVSNFLDRSIVEIGKGCIDLIRSVDESCASILEGSFKEKDNGSSDIPRVLDINGLGRLFLNVDRGIIPVTDLKDWILHGGSFEIENSYLKQFSQLYLDVLVCSEKDQVELSRIKTNADGFLKSEEGSLYDLNPTLILSFCEKLMTIGLQELACHFLGALIPDDTWISPWFIRYIDYLYEAEQYGELTRRFSGIPDENKSYWLLTKEAEFWDKFGDFERSALCSRLALRIDSTLPYAWHLLLRALRLGSENVLEVRRELANIPDSIFQDFESSKIPLVYEIACHVDAFFAERIMADWFVLSPVELANPLTQIHFESFIRRPPSEVNNPYKARYCREGVIYSDGFNSFNHILIEGVKPVHQKFIRVDSPKGKLLADMEVGETVEDPVLGEITLLERLSPYVAVLRAAAEIRHQGNDGGDPFKILTIPENEDELFPYLEKVLGRLNNKEEVSDEFLKLPLTMRGQSYMSSSPVRAALSQLCSKDKKSTLGLYSEGVEVSSNVQVTLDVYTAVYLSLLGVPSWLKAKEFDVVITRETVAILNGWLEEVASDDFLTLGLHEGELVRETSASMRQNNADFLNELRVVVEMATVLPLKHADFPHELIQIRRFVDESVYSTLQLCYANSVPLLSIDHNLCHLYRMVGFSTGNIHGLIEDFLTDSSKEVVRRCIALSLFQGLPLPIFYRDVVKLASSKEADDLILVEKFLQDYGAPSDEDEAIRFQVAIAANVINSYCAKSSEYPLVSHIYQSIFNLCARDALSKGYGETGEGRFASFLFGVFSECRGAETLIRQAGRFAHSFAQGYFLDVDVVQNHVDRLFDNLDGG